jgi:hypothetical protein
LCSEETRNKIGQKIKEYHADPENKNKFKNKIKQTFKEGRVIHNKGKPMSKEQKEKISKTKKEAGITTLGFTGHNHSEESKKKISEKISGEKNGMFGRAHTEKAKQKIREAQLTRHNKKSIL